MFPSLKSHYGSRGRGGGLEAHLKQAKCRRRTWAWGVFICALTFDIETDFPFNTTFVIPDSVATLICICNTAEGDIRTTGADATLIALRWCPCSSQHHQTWSAGGKVKEEELFLNLSCYLCLTECTSMLQNVITYSLGLKYHLLKCLPGLCSSGSVFKGDGRIHPRQMNTEFVSIFDHLLNGAI